MTPQQSVMFFWKVNSELAHSGKEFREAGISMVDRGFVLPVFVAGPGDEGYRCRFNIRGTAATVKVTFDKDNKPTYIATTADGKFTVTGDENTRPSDVVIKLSNAMRGK